MTFSSLLGRGVTPAGPSSGPSGMGDSEMFHYVDRGSNGWSSGGGKGGGKGSNQSAMSALTLLMFLFFINLLQNCLKESMMPTGAAVMVMPANRSARHTRSLGESETEEISIDALPGPGVYWDSNVLIREKGDSDVSETTREDTNDSSNKRGDSYDESESSVSVGDMDYEDDYPEESSNNNSKKHDLQGSGMITKKHSLEPDKTQHVTSLVHKHLHTSDQEWQEKHISPSEHDNWNQLDETTARGSDEKDNAFYRYYSISEPSERIGLDYYQYDDNDDKFSVPNDPSVLRDIATEDPGTGGFVNDRYDIEESNNEGISFMNIPSTLGEYVRRAVHTVYGPIIDRVRSSFNIGQCSELVVCEAHRLGSAWGTSGLLLASGFSEVMLWMYGNDDEHRRLIIEAASTGRERQSCRMQIQQCEDKSRTTSALPFMANVLEQLIG